MPDFTIIDDVPRPILADALEIARGQVLRDARSELSKRIALAAQDVGAPAGRHDRFPTEEQARAIGAGVLAAVEAYIDQLDLATRIHGNVEQLRGEVDP